MSAMYTHCPHCGFPVVVSAHERPFVRVCRQCRRKFQPGVELEQPGVRVEHRRTGLRRRVRQARRSMPR